MDYLQAGMATEDEDFLLRVKVAMFLAAQQVRNEASDTPNHANRGRLAEEVLATPARRAPQFAWLCATNPAIADTVKVNSDGVKTVGAPDDAIQFTVNSNWDVVAGWPSR
jgi:hypothetical protein